MKARHVLAEVPLWFHTFALEHAKHIYTPGVALRNGATDDQARAGHHTPTPPLRSR
jgi:hypothetical protein